MIVGLGDGGLEGRIGVGVVEGGLTGTVTVGLGFGPNCPWPGTEYRWSIRFGGEYTNFQSQ